MSTRPGTVVVAVYEDLLRQALADALDREPDLSVVGLASRDTQAVDVVRDAAPALVVVAADLDGPQSGIRLCREVRRASPGTHVLVLLADQEASAILAALEHGAVGTVWRGDELPDVLRTVRAALRGEACVPRRMLGGVLNELITRRRRDDEVQERYHRLSRRERQVLRLLAHGHDHTRIASDLVISPQTAKTHIQNILEKLEVHSRIEAAGLALEHALIDVGGNAE